MKSLVINNLLNGKKHQIGVTGLDSGGNVEFNIIKTDIQKRDTDSFTYNIDINDIDELVVFFKTLYDENDLDWPLDK